MKIRTDFVTNSSSSSFIVSLKKDDPFGDFVEKNIPKENILSIIYYLKLTDDSLPFEKYDKNLDGFNYENGYGAKISKAEDFSLNKSSAILFALWFSLRTILPVGCTVPSTITKISMIVMAVWYSNSFGP